MDAPPVQYVRTSDGYDIAYALSGEGRPFVFLPQPMSHIQVLWTKQTFVHPWLEGLAARFRLIQYDGRGQGMSSRGLTEGLSMFDLTADFEAVVERLGLERFVIMAVQAFGHPAIRYAVEHPERVEALVLVTCATSFATWSIGLLRPLADGDWDAMMRSQAGLSQASDIAASVERQKQYTTQADYRVLAQAIASSTIAEYLPKLRTPTLVLHPRQSLNLPPEESMKLAAAIPNARMALIDGATPLGDHAQGLKAIEDFLASLPPHETPIEYGVQIPGAASVGLSSREVEVLRLIAAGKSNSQIATELVISLNTVQRHVSNIFGKIDAANRAEAAAYATRHGLA